MLRNAFLKSRPRVPPPRLYASLVRQPRPALNPYVPQSYGSRFYSSNRYPSSYPRRISLRAIFLAVSLFTTVSAATYVTWKIVTYNRYPPKVAALLRKALHAELKGNYEEALKWYVLGLKEADRIRLGDKEDISQEQQTEKSEDLGEGEVEDMFPRPVLVTLGVPGTKAYKAAQEYAKKGPPTGMSFYTPTKDIEYLSNEYTGIMLKIAEMCDKLSKEGIVQYKNTELNVYRELNQSFLYAFQSNLVPKSQRLPILKKDLLILLKADHLAAGQASPRLAQFILKPHLSLAETQLQTINPKLAQLFDFDYNTKLEPSFFLKPARPKYDIPIGDEFFAVRELYARHTAADGDCSAAIKMSLDSTRWMKQSGMGLDQVLMEYYTAGTYLYLLAEREQADKYKNQPNAQESSPFMDPPKVGSPEYENLDKAANIFRTIIDTIKQSYSSSSHFTQLDALATYSLGVLQLHNGQLDSARSLLTTALTSSISCNYKALIDQIEMELATVTDLQRAKETGDSAWFNGIINRKREDMNVPFNRMVPILDDNEASKTLQALSEKSN